MSQAREGRLTPNRLVAVLAGPSYKVGPRFHPQARQANPQWDVSVGPCQTCLLPLHKNRRTTRFDGWLRAGRPSGPPDADSWPAGPGRDMAAAVEKKSTSPNSRALGWCQRTGHDRHSFYPA